MKFSQLSLLFLLSGFSSIAYGGAISLNVCDFGAIPNDGKDDTAAIEKAVAAAESQSRSFRPENGSSIGCGPSVFFPSGIYLLGRQVEVPQYVSLHGDPGKAIIQWSELPGTPDKCKGTMFNINAYTNKVENLKFVGGQTHLLFYNQNVNQTVLEVKNCEFQHSTGFAIRAIPSGKADHLSAQLTISGCKFIFNYQCLESYCDYTTLLDCWMELRQPQMIDGAAMVNRSGHLFLDRMLGVPCADISKSEGGKGRNLDAARWVDNYGNFTAVNSRFGGEGAGIPTVYHFTPFKLKYPWICGGTIRILSSSISTGSHSRPMSAIVVLHSLPQQVVIRDNIGPVNSVAFMVADNFNLQGEIEKLKKSLPKKGVEINEIIRYSIEGNLAIPDLLISLPEPLNPFINKRLEIK